MHEHQKQKSSLCKVQPFFSAHTIESQSVTTKYLCTYLLIIAGCNKQSFPGAPNSYKKNLIGAQTSSTLNADYKNLSHAMQVT